MERSEVRDAPAATLANPSAQAPSLSLHVRLGRVLCSGTAVMLAGTVVATIGAYVFQLLGGRALGPTAFAPVTVLWTVQFLVITVVMLPIEQMVIRRLELTRGRSAGLRDSVTPLAALLLGAAACVSAATAALSRRLLEDNLVYVLLATALVAGYGVFAIARGFLAGGHRYEAYGVATAAESLARILLAAAVLMLITDGIGLALVMVVAPLAVLAVRPFRRTGIGASAAEPAAGTEPGADVLVGDAGHFLAPMVLANGASQTVLGAGPLVVAALGASPATVSAVFVTFTLFRGPMWMVQSVLARVLPPFTALARRHEHQALRRWALRLAAMGASLSGFAYPVGWWLGPDVVSLLFGRQFAPSAALAALVATGTALAAVTLFASQILVAEGRAGRICAAWGLALVVAAVALRLPGAADMRVGLSFLAGEITAFVLVTAFAARSTSGSPRLRYSTVVEKVRA